VVKILFLYLKLTNSPLERQKGTPSLSLLKSSKLILIFEISKSISLFDGSSYSLIFCNRFFILLSEWFILLIRKLFVWNNNGSFEFFLINENTKESICLSAFAFSDAVKSFFPSWSVYFV